LVTAAAGQTRAARAAATWPERLRSFLSTEHHLIGASLLRIGLGLVVLYQLLGHFAERGFLWGPRGVYPLWLFERDLRVGRAPSFLAVESELLFEVVYGLSIVVAVLYVLGWRTRWIGIWLYVLTWSLIKRNPLLRTGGDSIVLVMLPFLLLMNTSAYLSADSKWRGIGDSDRPAAGPFAALFHNVGLLGVMLQLCFIYLFAGVYKLLGEHWPQGTAMYYVLRAPEFTLPGVSELIYLNPVLVPVLTYATLVFELSFPLLVWSARTRLIAVGAAVAFHLSTAVLMGLAVFAAQALVFQCALVADRDYRALWRRSRGILRIGAL
jgi:antimicrobial peptide system SdpB family protein